MASFKRNELKKDMSNDEIYKILNINKNKKVGLFLVIFCMT